MPDPSGVDPRFLQANERTLLAWVRTGLATMAFGFVLERSGALTRLLGGREASGRSSLAVVGLALVVLGALANLAGVVEFLRIRRGLWRGATAVPSSITSPALAVLVAAAGLALAALLVVH